MKVKNAAEYYEACWNNDQVEGGERVGVGLRRVEKDHHLFRTMTKKCKKSSVFKRKK